MSHSKLSLASAVKLKKHVHDWRLRAHEHALDHGMAIGFRDVTGAHKHVKKKAEAEGNHDLERSKSESHGQTNVQAIMNLLNNGLGSGVLCVPMLVRNAGIAGAVIMLVCSAILNRLGLMLVLKCMDLAAVDASYNGVGRVAFGNKGRLMVVFIFICMSFGCMVSYVDATASAVGGLMEYGGLISNVPDNMLFLQLGTIFIAWPTTYIRTLTNIVPISVASFIGALIVVACVVAQCIAGLAETGIDWGALRLFPDSTGIFLMCLPTAVVVFSIQAGGSITMSALEDPSDENKAKVSKIAYIIFVLVNLSIGLPSYMHFKDATTGNIIDALPDCPLTLIAKICILDLVVPSYMFMMIPCRVALIELLFRKNEAKQEATWGQFLAVTTGVNIAAVFVATLVADLSLVIGLVGAVAANHVAFVLPCACYLALRSRPIPKDEVAVPFKSASSIPYCGLIVFAYCSMVLGVYFLLAK